MSVVIRWLALKYSKDEFMKELYVAYQPIGEERAPDPVVPYPAGQQRQAQQAATLPEKKKPHVKEKHPRDALGRFIKKEKVE